MAKRKPTASLGADLVTDVQVLEVGAEHMRMSVRFADRPAAAPTPSDDDLLDALCQHLASHLPHVADEIRSALADQRRVWGGQAVYIRSAAPEQRAQQRREFLAAFNGANKRELMRRFGISRATAQRWIEAYYRERRCESAHAMP